MKLALLVIATLALVCLSWAMDADNEQKDVKLPGNIELKRQCNFCLKSYTIALCFTYILHLSESELFPLEENRSRKKNGLPTFRCRRRHFKQTSATASVGKTTYALGKCLGKSRCRHEMIPECISKTQKFRVWITCSCPSISNWLVLG